ncbi:unnamed protein product, partial [Notodromas monacha]
MKSGDIADEQLSASSSFDVSSVGPRHARLGHEIDGGAWCPNTLVSTGMEEWLEIRLKAMHVITGVESQGRFGNGQGLEYSEKYRLQYWRPGFNQWRAYKARNGTEILEGNRNTYVANKNALDPPIIASKIRILPFSHHVRTVCMRVELHGCNYTGGVVSYSMPQGERWNQSVELLDWTYDGKDDSGFLSGGLGQLVDGRTGQEKIATLKGPKSGEQ